MIRFNGNRNMTRNFDFVVVGGGLAGATAVETLRTEGAEGSILLLAAEPHLPYHRPPLSKSAITAEQVPPPKQVLSKSRYRELGIELLLGTPVAAIDPARQTLRTRPGPAQPGPARTSTTRVCSSPPGRRPGVCRCPARRCAAFSIFARSMMPKPSVRVRKRPGRPW